MKDGIPFEMSPFTRALLDIRGKPCGYVQIHQPTFFEKFIGKEQEVTILLLSDAHPGDLIHAPWSRSNPLSYAAETTDDELVQDITKGPKIECSGWEGKERDGWQGDPFKFNFYNVMLIFTPYMLTDSERKDDTTEVFKISERAGLGLLHNQALQWALPPGPQKRTIFLN
jgi:hypothetical protein